MKIEQWPIDNIIPYDNNPRINDDAVDDVAISINEYGIRQPIVVDSEGVVIVGHTRLKAARKLGMESFPVHVAEGLSKVQARAYRIADNRTAEGAAWDTDLLEAEINALLADGVDIELTGFDQESLDELLAEGSEAEGSENGGLTDPDDVPDEEEGEPVTRVGDVWLLGDHRLICGDSTEADVVARVLGDADPHLMVTDPPYGVNYDADWRNKALRENGKPYGGWAIGIVENDNKADWRDVWALFPGDVAYVWHAPGGLSAVFYESLVASGFDIRMQIIWAKNQLVIGRGHYHLQHEPCWYAVRKGKTGHWSGDRTQTTLWEIDKPHRSETGHSAQKPIECMNRPIINNSVKGDFIYEPFSGSGTTIIAAEQTGRKCLAIEIAPRYVDMAIRRWQNFTGEKAVLEATGEAFSG